MAPFYAAFDALVLPSANEGHSRQRDRSSGGRSTRRRNASRGRARRRPRRDRRLPRRAGRRGRACRSPGRLAADPTNWRGGWERRVAPAFSSATRSSASSATSTISTAASWRKEAFLDRGTRDRVEKAAQAVLERHLGLPTQHLRARDVRLARLWVVHGQRLEDGQALQAVTLSTAFASSSSVNSSGLPGLTGRCSSLVARR